MGSDLTGILAAVERQGIKLKASGGQLLASPKGAVSDGLRGMLLEHKGEILVRLEANRLIRQILDKVNSACPPGWQPSPAAWCCLDEIQWQIDAARDRDDVAAVGRLCAEYGAEAGRLFERWKRGPG